MQDLGVVHVTQGSLEMVPIAWTLMNVLNQEITAMSMLLVQTQMVRLHALVTPIQQAMAHTVILSVISSPVKQMHTALIQPWVVNVIV
jgi:hypothetical protein